MACAEPTGRVERICQSTPPWAEADEVLAFEWLSTCQNEFIRSAWSRLQACGGTLDDAADCVADAYLTAWRTRSIAAMRDHAARRGVAQQIEGLSAYDPDRFPGGLRVANWGTRAFRNWFYQILHSVVSRRLHQLCGGPVPLEGDVAGENEEADIAGPGPATGGAGAVDWNQEIEPYLAFLKEEHVEALQLFHLHGRSHHEAATLTAFGRPCSEGAMRVRVHRARHSLKAVTTALSDMTDSQRQVIHLAVRFELSAKEVVSRAAAPRDQVRQSLQDAYAALKSGVDRRRDKGGKPLDRMGDQVQERVNRVLVGLQHSKPTGNRSQ